MRFELLQKQCGIPIEEWDGVDVRLFMLLEPTRKKKDAEYIGYAIAKSMM